MNVSASIVLYNNNLDEILELIKSLEIVNVLFIIDNSPNDDLSLVKKNPKVKYIHNPSNPGFGSAHNIAIQKAIEQEIHYHFIVNPDIHIKEDVISEMVNYISINSDIGMMMPQILNLDGSIQNLPKLLPSPYSLLMRKLKKPKFLYTNFINRYELRFVDENIIYNAPVLSGCFTLLNLKAIEDIGMYDDKFFMYFEDWDLSRRMHEKYKTVYFPKVSVFHGYDSGANKSRKLFKIFVNSAIAYFNKWGWVFDIQRKKMNKKALSQFTK